MTSGRLHTYTQEIADEICSRLAEGRTLRDVCRDAGMPPESTVRLWALDDREGFAAQYARAREIGYLAMADEIMEIADDGQNDWMERHGDENKGWQENGEALGRSRLRVDTRKWALSKALPKVYGDKLTTEVTGKDGGPIQTEEVSALDRINRRLTRIAAGSDPAGDTGEPEQG